MLSRIMSITKQAVRTSNKSVPLHKSSSGVIFDFTQSDDYRVAVKQDNQTVFYDPDSVLVNNSTTPVVITTADGSEQYSPHNLFINSSSPSTQSYASAIVGETYTVGIIGIGSVEIRSSLPDGNTLYGSATQSAPLTFIATKTTIRLATITGTVQRIQLNRGSVLLKYLQTAGSSRYGVPISRHPVLDEMMLLSEPGRTNYLLNSGSPTTQTVALTAGTYTLWVVGSGNVSLSGGPVGTSSAESPVTFVLEIATSVTFTVVGTITFFQCENGSSQTSKIYTWDAARARSTGYFTSSLSSFPELGNEFVAYCDYVLNNPSGITYIYAIVNDINNRHVLYQNSGVNTFTSVSAGVISSSPVATSSYSNRRMQFTGLFRTESYSLSADGNPTTSANNKIANKPNLTTLNLGTYSNQVNSHSFYTRRFALVPTEQLPPSDVPGYFYTYPDEYTVYDIILIAGQSNCTSGFTIDTSIDVAGERADQLSMTTTGNFGSITGNVFGAIYPGKEPLRSAYVQNATLYNAIGFGVAFARDYYIPNTQTAPTRTLLINACVSNTGFYSATPAENRWNPGDDLYNFACSAVGAALSRFPKSRVAAILWMQGEWDAERGMSQSEYATRLAAMVDGMRAQFGAVPVVVGGMKPAWVAANLAVRNPVQLALADAPNNIALCGYADPYLSPSIGGSGGTDAHYTASEQRIFAGRFWDGFASATGIL